MYVYTYYFCKCMNRVTTPKFKIFNNRNVSKYKSCEQTNFPCCQRKIFDLSQHNIYQLLEGFLILT